MVLPGLFGLSLLALASALLQLVQTRMMTTPVGRPAAAQPAAHLPHPAAVLADLRLVPAGRPVHLLDHDHDLLDRPAVPDQWAGAACSRCSGGRPGSPANHTAAVPSQAVHPARRSPTSSSRRDRRHSPPRSARRSTTDSAAGTIRPAEAHQPARETPMSEYQEFTGKTVEEALRNAREAFGVSGLDDLDFEILTPGSRGVLGMGAEPARIIAAPAIGAGWRGTTPRGRRRRAAARHRRRARTTAVRATTAIAGGSRRPSAATGRRRRPSAAAPTARRAAPAARPPSRRPAPRPTGADEHVPLRATAPRPAAARRPPRRRPRTAARAPRRPPRVGSLPARGRRGRQRARLAGHRARGDPGRRGVARRRSPRARRSWSSWWR